MQISTLRWIYHALNLGKPNLDSVRALILILNLFHLQLLITLFSNEILKKLYHYKSHLKFLEAYYETRLYFFLFSGRISFSVHLFAAKSLVSISLCKDQSIFSAVELTLWIKNILMHQEVPFNYDCSMIESLQYMYFLYQYYKKKAWRSSSESYWFHEFYVV